MATTTQRQKTTTEYDENFANMMDKIMKANLDYQRRQSARQESQEQEEFKDEYQE